MKRIQQLLRLLTSVACALLAVSALGQTDMCMTGIGGLGGLPTIDGIVDGFSIGTVNSDPGWNGATRWSLSGSNGTPIATKFQAGNDGTFLYLSWKIDEPVYGQDNTIVVGFADTGAAANTNWLIHITPFNVMPAPNGANQVPTAISYWRNSGGNAWRTDASTSGNGTWLATNIRVSRSTNTWAVEMKIPVTNVIGNAAATTAIYLPAAGSYRFYTDVLSTFGFVDPVVVQDPWPTGVIIPTGNTAQANTPAVTSWGFGSLNARPECTGVSLAWSDIGVEKPANSGTIVSDIERYAGAIAEPNIAACNALADGANPGDNGPQNTFLGRPLNEQPTNADKVFATFRIANWGVPAPQEFDSIGSPSFIGVTNNPTPVSGAFANGTKTNLRAQWTLNYKQSCQYKFQSHQCIQVDLDSNDPATRFKNKSVQRNMNFVPLSRFERRSRISGSWDGPGPHEFLLLVLADEQVTRGGQRPASWDRPVDPVGTNQPGGHGLVPATGRTYSSFANEELVDATSGMTGVAQLAWTADALKLAAPGDKIILNGRSYRSSTRVGGFGYVGSHEGAFDHFAWQFQGAPGTNLQRLTNDVFLLTVNDGDEAFVDTVLETVGDVASSAGKWRVFVDAGINSPDGQLDGKFSINAGLERRITNHWSFEGILGRHSFDGPLVDVDAWQLSANAKYFFGSGPLHPFVNGGVGLYRIDPPDDTEFGTNAGAGLLYDVTAKWGVEAVYNHHFTDPVDWSTLQLGLRWSF
ncbi:MAG: outer membrane beta-barrel protein [Acidobacteriota bacterium]